MPGHLTPLTILHLNVKSSLSTGSVNQMLQAASIMAARGHRTMIASREDEQLRRFCAESGVAFEPISFRSELDILSLIRLRRLIQRLRPDIIHVHKGRAHSMALAALTGNPEPALIVNRGVSFPLKQFNAMKYRSPRVGRIVAVCEEIRQTVIRTGQVDPDRVVTVYAGTDPERFDPATFDRNDYRREAGIGEDEFVVAHVGIRPWKGYREAMESFARFHREVPASRILLIGGAKKNAFEELEQALDELGLRDAAIITGYRSDMARILFASDVVMDASWDGTGITGTIREGMCLGRPVIATDCGGNRELIDSPEVGWLVPPRQVEPLYNALREIHDRPERAARIAGEGRRRVLSRFTVDHRIDHLGLVYKGAIAERVALGMREALPHRAT